VEEALRCSSDPEELGAMIGAKQLQPGHTPRPMESRGGAGPVRAQSGRG
jgi:hypothetical protein